MSYLIAIYFVLNVISILALIFYECKGWENYLSGHKKNVVFTATFILLFIGFPFYAGVHIYFFVKYKVLKK